MAAWVWQGCHTLLICENLCNLWEAHLSQKVLCVLRILWEYSCSPTDFTDRHRWLGCVGFPTESTDLTELLAEKNLPRNSRISQNYLLRRTSHGIHGSHRITCSEESPTESTDLTELLAEKNLPRNSRNPQKLGCAIGCMGMAGMPYSPNL